MRCTYRFPLKGCFRPETGAFFTDTGWSVRFDVDPSGYATHVLYSLPIDPKEAPNLRRPTSGALGHINVPTPNLEAVRRHARVLEDALSFFGAFSISTDEWWIDWIPENESERNTLSMKTFACERDRSCPDDAPLVPVDLVSRCVSKTDNLHGIDSLLCFCRHGREDLQREQFIDAFYDFFFVIESRFGGGKFHKKQLLEEFKKHDELISAVSAAKAERAEWQDGTSRSQPYEQKDPIDILGLLVKVRGELHHHTARKRGIWHPGEQAVYRADAMFLGRTVHRVCLDLLKDALGIV